MTGYDALALRYVEHPLPYRRYGLASFVATAFGNNLGASAVVGAALRARVYSSWQVPGSAITRIIGFNAVTLALGAAVLAGTGVLHDPVRAGEALHLPRAAVLALGSLLLASVVGYLAWAAAGRSVGARRWRVAKPAPGLAVAQVLLSTFEWLTMAAALHVLLPAGDVVDPIMTTSVASKTPSPPGTFVTSPAMVAIENATAKGRNGSLPSAGSRT